MGALLVLAGSALSGCSSAAGTAQVAREEAEAARREERLKLMQRIWTEETAAPLPGDPLRPAPPSPAKPGPITYPAGEYDGVQMAPHVGMDGGVAEPVR
jgi:hypothetical protein